MGSIDRTSFYGILDTGYVSEDDWLEKYEALERGGAGIIQIRAKGSTFKQKLKLTERVADYRQKQFANGQQEQPILVINDDLELCLSFPDFGLHIGQEDLPAAEAREKMGPSRVLGLSTHSKEQVRGAVSLGPEVLSYFAVGPVFPTQTKPDYIPVGLDLVSFAAKLENPLPFFCIGGINRGNIPKVRSAGAKRIVTVSDVLCSADTASAVQESISLIRGR